MVIPDIPPALSNAIYSGLQQGAETQVGAWFDELVALAQEAFEFDTVIIGFARPTIQATSIFGINIMTKDVPKYWPWPLT